MKKNALLLFTLILLLAGCRSERYRLQLDPLISGQIQLFPQPFNAEEGTPSPTLSENQHEYILARLNTGLLSWFDATVENGEIRDYKTSQFGKGNQLMVDEEDFPQLAKTGLHSRSRLRKTFMVTGRSVSKITIDGRPGRSSGAGFMADDETIVSVLWADNETVRKLGLNHADIARPWFHIWNAAWALEKANEEIAPEKWFKIDAVKYHNHTLSVQIEGSRGWQESIIPDEILGNSRIEISRDLDSVELDWLEKRYSHLTSDELDLVKESLTNEHSGEMVAYYINRYGFYEGHTDFRIDPVTTAFLFGLRSLPEIDRAIDQDLFAYYTTHFTKNPNEL